MFYYGQHFILYYHLDSNFVRNDFENIPTIFYFAHSGFQLMFIFVSQNYLNFEFNLACEFLDGISVFTK